MSAGAVRLSGPDLDTLEGGAAVVITGARPWALILAGCEPVLPTQVGHVQVLSHAELLQLRAGYRVELCGPAAPAAALEAGDEFAGAVAP